MSDSLGDQIAGRLLDEIVGGAFPPGSPLPPEWELAEREGASRLTIREAVRVLRQKSVVEVVRGRGTYVQPREQWSPLDPAVLGALARHPDALGGRMHALLEARLLIEVGVAELAAARRSDADLAAMAAALESMRDADTDADVDAFVASDMAFHQAVMAAAGNPVIAALYGPITHLLQETRERTSRDSLSRRHAIVAHERILADIDRRNPGQAGWAMREHLVQTGEDFELRPAAKRARSTRRTAAPASAPHRASRKTS